MVKCSIPSCEEVSKSKFSVPKEKHLFEQWEKSLNMKLSSTSKVCEAHFEPGDVVKTWESGKGFSKYTVLYNILIIKK